MLDIKQFESAGIKALTYFYKAGIVLSEEEKRSIEVADFGLNDLDRMGLEVLVYVNTTKVCAKELLMFSGQVIKVLLYLSSRQITWMSRISL
jgi:D-lyxose ketol-isomerase